MLDDVAVFGRPGLRVRAGEHFLVAALEPEKVAFPEPLAGR
ncbi:hypothetical protein ACFHW2_14115 [Actinomadura sp. LOL_016]